MLIKTIQSSSSNRTYELRIGDDGRIYCTCPSWKFQHGIGGMCKHVKAYLAEIAAGAKLTAATPAPTPARTTVASVAKSSKRVRKITPGEV